MGRNTHPNFKPIVKKKELCGSDKIKKKLLTKSKNRLLAATMSKFLKPHQRPSSKGK
jgi:hypothetical protein